MEEEQIGGGERKKEKGEVLHNFRVSQECHSSLQQLSKRLHIFGGFSGLLLTCDCLIT